MRHLPLVHRFLLVIAVSSLVLNDVARVVFPQIQQIVMQSAQADKDGNYGAFTEEEVKHKNCAEEFLFALLAYLPELDAAIAHRITDDDVRHLAFLAVFSPPPDRA